MGPAWRRDVHLLKNPSITLQLSRNVPVRGRLVDLEGKPISGVRISVRGLRSARSAQAIQEWVKETKKKPPSKEMEDMYTSFGATSDRTGMFPFVENDGGLAHSSPALPADVERPGFDRALLRPGVVHFGIGAFHRAHQETGAAPALLVHTKQALDGK